MFDVMRREPAFLLNAQRLVIALIVSAPKRLAAKRFKCIALHGSHGFRGKASAPKGLGNPIAHFELETGTLAARFTTRWHETDASYRLIYPGQANGKGIRRRKNRPNDLPAFLNTSMRRPACSRPHVRVARICKKIRRIRLVPRAKRQTLGMNHHVLTSCLSM